MPVNWAFGFAILSGLGFTLLGVAYRMGQVRALSPARIIPLLCLCGALFFAMKMPWATVGQLPVRVVVISLIAGLSQYVSIRLIGVAMRHGPFAPAWCAISLYFVPVAIYGAAFAGETILPLQYVSLLAAIGAVVWSAGAVKEAASPAARRPVHPVVYGVLLLAILLINGLANIALKDMTQYPSPGPDSFMRRYEAAYFVIFYASLGLAATIEQLLRGQWRDRLPAAAALGLLAGAGSIVGVISLSRCAGAGAIMFTLSSAVTMLGASLVSVAFFKERPTGRWAGTVALTLVAILCAYPPAPKDRPVNAQMQPAGVATAVTVPT